MIARPSSLPKLALCGQFESSPGSSDAAARGTRIDALIREMWTTGETPEGAEDEIKLARWAVNKLIVLSAGKGDVKTDEISCKIYVPILNTSHVMDAVCKPQRWLADLKSGQTRSYREQMAAYAFGCMTDQFETEWTTHLLFADQDKIVSETFTFEQARDIVQAAIDNIGTAPKVNDYCGWCAKSLTCSARLAAQENALATTSDTFLQILADPVRLGEFLTNCKTLEKFQASAEEKVREYLEADPQSVPGWILSKGRTSEFVDARQLYALREQLGIPNLFEAFGTLSGKKFRELWAEKCPDQPFPEQVLGKKTTKPTLTKI